jgi:hypothetical protein
MLFRNVAGWIAIGGIAGVLGTLMYGGKQDHALALEQTNPANVLSYDCADKHHPQREWHLKIGLTSAPGAMHLTMDDHALAVCPGDTVVWEEMRPLMLPDGFEILFKSTDQHRNNPFDSEIEASFVTNREGFQSPPLPAVTGQFKYSVCAPDCSTAADARIDSSIIVMGD